MNLRPYQNTLLTNIHDAWRAGHKNVLAVSPTGSGKTLIFSEAIRNHSGAAVAIAHRQELVSQMSLALAKDDVRHRIIGPQAVIKWIVQLHIQELGRSYYDPNSKIAAAGVGTLASRRGELDRWAQQVTLWVQDEAHHLLRKNQWGKAIEMFPNARGLGVTATPERTDGNGLGRHADGVFDTMIIGPNMRDLIGMGYLTDYRILCPPSDLDLSAVATGADGDYIRGQLAAKTRKSSVMGDVVTHYLQYAAGKLGVTFAPDVETATELAKRFMEAGVPAEVVTGTTPGKIRMEILRRFRERRIHNLVSVDIIAEGFDLPSIEVVSMARGTQSYGLYAQQFGRSLRPLEGKNKAIIIDHVGNVLRHGLPDRPRTWSLDRRERRVGSKATDVIPLRTCLSCMSPFEVIHPACPLCGWVPVPAGRNAPEQVDGDLLELDPATLAAMRGEIAKIDRHPDEVRRALERAGQPSVVCYSAAKQHSARLEAQGQLRNAISIWGSCMRGVGFSDSMSYRLFYYQFGTDILTAQTLGRPEADELGRRVHAAIGRNTRGTL